MSRYLLSSCAANGFAEVIIGDNSNSDGNCAFRCRQCRTGGKSGDIRAGVQYHANAAGKIPLSSLLQFIWFMLLFFAGITSSMSIIQPSISFLEDELSWKRSRAVAVTALLSFIMCLIGVFGLSGGAIDELDFWGGTFALVIFGTIEAVLFAWVLGIDKGWDELNRGAHIRLPVIFKYILKYVTPVYLLVILTAWFITDGWGFITLKGIDPSEQVNFLGVTLSKTVFIAAFRILLLMLLFDQSGHLSGMEKE